MIRQDNRSIKYANTDALKQFGSMIAYNPDEIGSLLVGMKGADKITKALSKMDKVFDATKFVAKFPSGTATYWAGKTANGAGAIIKGARASMIEGAVSDPIIDTAMGEISGANQDALNMVTNLFFDMSVVPALAKGFQVGKKGVIA